MNIRKVDIRLPGTGNSNSSVADELGRGDPSVFKLGNPQNWPETGRF